MAEDGRSAIVDSFDRWLDERADELGTSREAVLARILAGIEEPATAVGGEDEDEDEGGGEAGTTLDLDLDLDDGTLVDGETLDGLDERIAALDDRVTALEGRERIDPGRGADLNDRIDDLGDRIEDVEAGEGGALGDRVADLADRVTALEGDLDEKIQDVRERVIQVKREADSKAATDHDHDDLRERTQRTAAAAEDLDARVDDLERRVDEGFENFEEVLEHLTETSDQLEGRAETLARATIGLRDRVADFEAERSARAVADDIRATANRNGDATATCGACSRKVRLGLLSRPECPHCAAAFEDLEPSSGLFGSATLLVGPPPALEGGTDDGGAASPADLFEGDDENREGEP